jgi:hypothetical protein
MGSRKMILPLVKAIMKRVATLTGFHVNLLDLNFVEKFLDRKRLQSSSEDCAYAL